MDRKIEKKRWSWQRISLIVGAVALVGLLFSAIYRDAGTSRLNIQQERLLTDTVNTGVFREYITVFGTVEPIKTVYLDAIESGRVEEVFVENGEMMQAGQQIMRLSNLELQLNVLNQEAQIVTQINNIRNTSILMDQQSLSLKEQSLEAQYRLDQLEKDIKRNRSLYKDKVIAQVDYERTEDEYNHLIRRRKLLAATIAKDSMFQTMQEAQMTTTLDLMRRNLNIAKSSLNNLVVTAPIAGQVSSLNVEIGQLITRGNRIAQIDFLNDFKIRARIDEFYISRIFPQQEASFVLDGKTYKLSIYRIYPEVSNGTFEVDMLFEGARPDNIKRGQSISLRLSLSDETQAKLLAKGGFYQTTGGNWVYVIDPRTGVAHKRDIRVGRQNPNYYEVLEGLDEGDVVIVSSYENYGNKDELVLK